LPCIVAGWQSCWLLHCVGCLLACLHLRPACVCCGCPWEHSRSCRRLYAQAPFFRTYFLSLGVVEWPWHPACTCNMLADWQSQQGVFKPCCHSHCMIRLFDVRPRTTSLCFRGATCRAHSFSGDGSHCFQPARAGRSAMVMQHSACTSMALYQDGAPSM
jgi:hypothetical protein